MDVFGDSFITLLIVDLVIEIVVIGLLIGPQTFLYYKTIGFGRGWRGTHFVPVMLSVIVTEAFLQYASVNINGYIGWDVGLDLLANAVIVLYPVLFMGGHIKERFFWGFVCCTILRMAGLLCWIVMFSESNDRLQALIAIATLFIIHTVLILVVVHFNTEGRRFLPGKYWIGSIICFIAILSGYVVIQIAVASKSETSRMDLRIHMAIFLSVFFLVVILFYFIFYYICRYFAQAAEAHAMMVQNDIMERYLAGKQAADERIQILSHDLKHSLIEWRALAEAKGDVRALQSIREYEEQLYASLLINVEHEAANAILNQKCREAGQRQVTFMTDGILGKDLTMGRLDICSLLGNLLDNAIEAASQAETASLRCVKLSLRQKGNLLVLVAENGYAEEPVMENGVFVTSKPNQSFHGFGSRSIRSIAEKYEGVIQYSFDHHWFKATVMLCGYPGILSEKN